MKNKLPKDVTEAIHDDNIREELIMYLAKESAFAPEYIAWVLNNLYQEDMVNSKE